MRLNRDDLRRMALRAGYVRPEFDAEQRISTIRDAGLGALLAAGRDVICDDTNLRAKYVRSLMEIADKAGAKVEFVDFTTVSVDECVRRDAIRPELERVGEETIRDMHGRYLAQLHGKPLPVPELSAPDPIGVEPYVPRRGAPRAVLVDVDGTIALLDRNPYDETLVSTDRPNEAVISVVRALHRAGHVPVFMSGRSEGCRADTEEWIVHHVFGHEWVIELYMRPAGDTRPDRAVKLELFNAHIRDRYDVRVVLDDRTSVVNLWRELGLVCLQVAPGDF